MNRYIVRIKTSEHSTDTIELEGDYYSLNYNLSYDFYAKVVTNTGTITIVVGSVPLHAVLSIQKVEYGKTIRRSSKASKRDA